MTWGPAGGQSTSNLIQNPYLCTWESATVKDSEGLSRRILLFAYLVDLIPTMLAFVIAAAVSLLLLVRYLVGVAGFQFARLAAIAQFAYMILLQLQLFLRGADGHHDHGGSHPHPHSPHDLHCENGLDRGVAEFEEQGETRNHPSAAAGYSGGSVCLRREGKT